MARGDATPRRAQQRQPQPRPASANAPPVLSDDIMAGPSSNYGRSALGGNAAASTSSTSVNIAARSSYETHYSRLGNNISSSPGQRLEPAADAPFLQTAESHLGRMTLVAPDNVRRRKAEEREKKKGTARRKRVALDANAETSHSAIMNAVALAGLPTTTTRPGPSAVPRRPKLGTSRSTSNLATLQQQQQDEQQRGQSQATTSSAMRRPVSPGPQMLRARSAQGTHQAESSTERDDNSAASITGPAASQTAMRPAQWSERQQRPPRRPARRERQGPRGADEQRDAARRAQETQRRDAVRAEVLRRATRRRRDIYADLPALGLPGASDEEEESVPPPPFPGTATRPLTPPPFPTDDDQWTEELRRRHEEYNANRPPDSPPPAFISDGEFSHRRDGAVRVRPSSSDRSLSDDESIDAQHSEEQKLWDADVAAGLSLEERLERARRRRDGDAIQDVAVESDGRAEPIANVSLGQLVTEARARRGLRSEPSLPQALESAQEAERLATLPGPDASAQVSQVAPQEPVSSASAQQEHRRATSASTPFAAQNTSAVPARTHKRVDNSAIGTGRGLISQGERQVENDRRTTKPTKLRPRPEGSAGPATYARFRNDASAAAHRRQALWGNALPDAVEPATAVAREPAVPASLRSERPEAVSQEPAHANSVLGSLPQPRRSSAGAALQSQDHEESSDSEDDWAREDNEMQRLQRLREGPSRQHALETSDSEQNDEDQPMPGTLSARRLAPPAAIELGKVGASVPKAPPPLVLGRSRGGGAAYSSSSEESSSDDDDGRLREYEDESDSESPEETDDVDSNVGQSLPAHSEDSLARPSLDKGKHRAQTPFPGTREESVPSTSSNRASSESARAGTFEEGSASSDDDLVPDSDEDLPEETNASATPTANTTDVSSRLKDLFTSPVLQTPQRPSVLKQDAITAKPADTQGGIDTARRAGPEEGTPEARARQAALEQLSQVKRSTEPLPPGVDRDSLAALERLLMRSGIGAGTAGDSSQNRGGGASSRLSRSNAINGRASFVNPRSSIAPRPLGRLPTITAATRHFPAERNAGREASPSEASVASGHAAMPGWMAKIPAAEREGLQAPLEFDQTRIGTATRRLSQAEEAGREEEALQRPPPLPARPNGSRVNAMIAAFESQSRPIERAARPPPAARVASAHRVPTQSSPSSQDNSIDDSSSSAPHRIAQLRRRPPPPPPSAFKRRTSADRLATVDGIPPPVSVYASHGASRIRDMAAVPPSNSIGAPPGTLPASPSRPLNPAAGTLSRSAQIRSRPLPTPPSVFGSQGVATRPPEVSANVQLANMASSPRDVERAPAAQRPMRDPQVATPEATALRDEERQANAALRASPVLPNEEDAEHDSDDQVEAEISPVSSPHARSRDSSLRISNQHRQASLGLTDLDIFASRLADARQTRAGAEGQAGSREGSEGSTQRRDTYDDLHLLAEFLGPAKTPGLTPEEMEALPVGRVEVTRRRIIGKRDDGRDKVKLSLAVAGIKVERCPVCLVQFKEGNMACVFPCMHALHERCAQRLLRNTKLCPTCREPVVGDLDPQ